MQDELPLLSSIVRSSRIIGWVESGIQTVQGSIRKGEGGRKRDDVSCGLFINMMVRPPERREGEKGKEKRGGVMVRERR